MKIEITYAELGELISNKTGKSVTLTIVSSDTVNVSTIYEQNLLITKVNVPINADIRFVEIIGCDVIMEYSIGEKIDKIAGLKIIGNIIDWFIRDKKMEDLITFDSSNRMRFTVHIGKYDKIAKTLEMVEIKDVRFEYNCVICEIKVK